MRTPPETESVERITAAMAVIEKESEQLRRIHETMRHDRLAGIPTCVILSAMVETIVDSYRTVPDPAERAVCIGFWIGKVVNYLETPLVMEN